MPEGKLAVCQVARYLYFPPDVAKFEAPQPALLDRDTDEPAEDGLLAAVGQALADIHAATFQDAEVRSDLLHRTA